MSRYCGIDFGTSNSVVAIVGDDADEPPIFTREPSLMFFADNEETTTERFCGARALVEYIARGTRGRFFQSVKSILPDPGFTHTRINGKPFSAEDLVAVMLRFLKEEGERLVGQRIDAAVIGRPARFSDDPSRERIAQERLERAVAQAGFTSARYELEPVAGAYAYASRPEADRSEHGERIVFVGDHGGGTSDFTVMRLVTGTDGRPRSREVLATHGIRAGGDDFDGAIMWNRLVDQFGHGTHYESFGKLLPIPVHIYHIISHWDQIHFLKTLSYREELRTFLRSSDNPMAIRRLIKLVEEDLGYFVFQSIEAAKIGLSTERHAAVEYENGKLRIHEAIERGEFEGYIADHTGRIDAAVEQVLAAAGNPPIDVAFLTGGTSRVPAVRAVVAGRVGEDRVVDDVDQFRSVAYGLALSARDHGLAS